MGEGAKGRWRNLRGKGGKRKGPSVGTSIIILITVTIMIILTTIIITILMIIDLP